MNKRRGRPSDKKEYVDIVMGLLCSDSSIIALRAGLNKMTCTELAILAIKVSQMKENAIQLPSGTPAQKERLEKIEEVEQTVANN